MNTAAKTKWGLAFCLALSIALQGCSAFQIRHTDDRGATRTYVTDTVFVGTGTFLDCLISPLHWAAGLFYLQPYIHSGEIQYPTFGASGCFMKAYGNGGLTGLLPLPISFFRGESATPRVRFMDINGNEVELQGGALEVRRVTQKINFSLK